MSHRGNHYFMWFIVFGLIAGLVSFLGSGGNLSNIDTEAYWLLGGGVLGMLISNQRLNEGKLSRYYDFIIGVILILAGLAGIGSHISQLSSVTSALSPVITGSGESAHLLGLSLAVFPSIVHLLLGYTSFRHGMKNSK
jgi:hypothetical protein